MVLITDPSTWPQRPDISYRRLNWRSVVAHAIRGEPLEENSPGVTLCGSAINGHGTKPKENDTLICIACMRAVNDIPLPTGDLSRHA